MENRSSGLHARLLLCVAGLVALAGLAAPAVQAQPAAPKAAASVVKALPSPDALQFSPVVETVAEQAGKPTAPPRNGPVPHNGIHPNVLSSELPGEIEPNGTPATATPLPLDANGYVQMQGTIFPVGDTDYFSFTGQAGDRVYAATMTSASSGNSVDSTLTLFASDGTTVIETDADDGSFAAASSSIAGATLPAAGTYYLAVVTNPAAQSLRPYSLHVRLQRGTPTAEVEANDTPATANVLPANGWVSGVRNPAAATEQDWFSFTANAGDTVYLSLDADPERDGVSWDGRLGIALFGDATNQILVVNDVNAGSVANPASEAMFFTIKTAGTYFAFVDSASAAVGGPTATYHLSVSIAPLRTPEPNCTTYTSTDVPKTIGPGTGLVSSVITVPGNPRISDLDVTVTLNHALMQDVDAHLRSPAGNDIGLFSDIGAAAVGGQAQMDVTFDDEAAIAPTFTALRNTQLKPELAYRLAWLDGENAGGTWTLDLYDDTAGANGGTLTGWSLRICEAPPPPACPPGTAQTTVYTTDFEAGAAGFTHTGTLDEWELGLPATLATTTTNPIAAFNSCASGTNCWKTDLDNTYNLSSSQDLTSPAINLAGLSAPVVVTWAQRYQLENASFDHYNVDARQVGGATPVRLFDWYDATMTDTVGNPGINIGASAGWAHVSARADSLAGLNTELNFHLDSDTSVNFAGVAVDDVTVTACRATTADLAITKTDGVTTATPGGSVTYTITASNAGPDAVLAATVADTFPASLTCTWTCVGAGGGTCTAAGSGNINDTTNLPVGGSTTYTASCAISPAATGSLSNTATVSSSVTDPTPGNNSATDTDTLGASADLSITKTDGVTTATPGGSTTYTITASNAGPSNAPGATVADTFPASLTCTWTCVGAGGGTCTAAGSGNINGTVNLPSGGSVTYTASCSISAAASGSLSNTATVAAPAGVTDPTPGNNSATDTDTLGASADLSITKTDGVTTATPGGSTTYTIVASNAGPSNATGATVADTFPASLTCTWTCVGAGGGTCTASGSGNINGTVNLPSGGSVTYTASCSISGSAAGTLVNTATVTAPAGTTDPTPGNNSATDSDTLAASADLSITKTDGVTSATPGGSTTYTIVASNAGPSNTAGTPVTDTFPASLTCTWTCAGAGGGTCTAAGSGNISDAANLPSGGSVTYTAVCSISGSATGSLVNTATIAPTAGVSDPVPGNNSATDTDALGASADLSITKTDGVTSATPGGSTTYTIVASNAGPSNATGATVTDTFPASLTCTWTCVGAGGGTCTAAGSGNISGTVNLPSGGSVTYTASCSISGAATGSLVNTATVAAPAGVTDPTPGNNSATDTDALGASADLSITKTDGVTSATPGGSTTYTITASNAGPSNATGATVADTFPAALTCSWTCAGAGGGTCTAAGSGNISDTANLPSGGSVTYTASCTISAAATGSLVNTATVTAPAGVTDPTPGNNSATDTDGLGAVADLSITKTDGLTNVLAGTSTTYTIVASNAGPSAVSAASVTDTFPAGLTCSWTCAGSAGGSCTAAGSGNLSDSANLPSGASVTYTATCAVAAGATGVLSNTASISAAGATDPNPADNSATDTTTIDVPVAGALLSGSKAVSGSFVVGGNVVYTIVLNNNGGPQADNPGNEFSDVLPAQLQLTSASASSGTAVASVGTNTVTWNGAIAAGGSVTITINASIRTGASGSIANQGNYSYDADGNGSNDASGVTDDTNVAGATDPTVFVVTGVVAPVVPVPALSSWALLAMLLGLFGLALRQRHGSWR